MNTSPDPEMLKALILGALPGAGVRVLDLRGDQGSYRIEVTSETFCGLSLIDQHRQVYAALKSVMHDGSAPLSIQTSAPKNQGYSK